MYSSILPNQPASMRGRLEVGMVGFNILLQICREILLHENTATSNIATDPG